MNNYTYIATDKLTEKGKLMFPVNIDLSAKNEKDALGGAKKLVKRKHYYLQRVTEIDDTCIDYQEKMMSLQQKGMEQIVKAISKIR